MNDAKARREEMFKMRGDGMTLKQIAEHFGISSSVVQVSLEKYKRMMEREKRSNDLLLGVRTYDDFLNLDVCAIGLSSRAENCMKNDRIKTIGQLIAIPEKALACVPNLGKKSIVEIKEAINELADKYQFERPYGQAEGVPLSNLGKIAAYWSAHIGTSIDAGDVVTMLKLMKLARAEAGAK